jgi:hypothetical protein
MLPARRLLIVLWSCGPDRPGGGTLAAAPLVHALAAHALEIEVELHFTSSAVRWLIPGVADAAHTDQAATRTVLDYLFEVREADIPVHACAMAVAEHLRPGETMLEGVRMAGAATVVQATMASDTRTLVF